MEERIQQLEAQVQQLTQLVNQQDRYKFLRLSGETPSNYLQAVNEGGSAQYVVTDGIDGLINADIEGRVVKIPYFL